MDSDDDTVGSGFRPAYLWNGSGWDQVGDPRARAILTSRGQPGGIATLDPSGDVPPAQLQNALGLYPLSEYGLGAAAIHPDMCSVANTAQISSRVGLYRTWIPAGTPINGLVMIVRAVGSGSSNGSVYRYVVFSDAGSLIGTSADDTTLFTTVGPRIKALTTPIAAETTGRFVYLGFVHQHATAPTFSVNAANIAIGWLWKVSGGALVTTANRRIQTITGVTTSMPSSFTPSGTGDFPLPFIGAY